MPRRFSLRSEDHRTRTSRSSFRALPSLPAPAPLSTSRRGSPAMPDAACNSRHSPLCTLPDAPISDMSDRPCTGSRPSDTAGRPRPSAPSAWRWRPLRHSLPAGTSGSGRVRARSSPTGWCSCAVPLPAASARRSASGGLRTAYPGSAAAAFPLSRLPCVKQRQRKRLTPPPDCLHSLQAVHRST